MVLIKKRGVRHQREDVKEGQMTSQRTWKAKEKRGKHVTGLSPDIEERQAV